MKLYIKKIITAILQWEAKKVLNKYNPKIVGVTGSVGKTSTKDAIFTVLSNSFYARKSEKSFNSELGVPLTILGCPSGWDNPIAWIKNILHGLSLIIFKHNYPHWLVLEIGADRPGDIKDISSWVKPDISVVTKLSKVPVHVEYFDSVESVYEEKSYLVRAVKSDGVLILNHDDEDVLTFKDISPTKNIITFGFEKGADVEASHASTMYENGIPQGVTFRAGYGGNSIPIVINGGIGKQHTYPALAALCVGLSQNLNMVLLSEALSKHSTPPGRMRIILGVKGSVILDDTYNSSPVAAYEALNALSSIETQGRRIAVLGDMMELGKYSPDEHKKIGLFAGQFLNVLLTVGVRSRTVAEGALLAGMSEENIFQYEDSKQAGKELELMIRSEDVILVKGSQSMRMERIVEEVMADPDRSEELLVRQNVEWKKR